MNTTTMSPRYSRGCLKHSPCEFWGTIAHEIVSDSSPFCIWHVCTPLWWSKVQCMCYFQNMYIVILRYTNCAVGYIGLDVWWLVDRKEAVFTEWVYHTCARWPHLCQVLWNHLVTSKLHWLIYDCESTSLFMTCWRKGVTRFTKERDYLQNLLKKKMCKKNVTRSHEKICLYQCCSLH